MDIPPKNQFVSLDTLEQYIEKYPEDTGKWLEFLEEHKDDNIITTYPYKPRNLHLEKTHKDSILQQAAILEESQDPVTHFSNGCMFCKKSWSLTTEVPTTTLICGHKFHTVCYLYNYYHTDRTHCVIENCDINTWDYIKQIDKVRRENNESAENLLYSSIIKRKDFKEDLKEFKTLISDVTRKHAAVRNSLKSARNELLHKHIFSINEMQADLNGLLKTVKENQEMEIYKNSLKQYRKKAKSIFRKYHLSFRDLIRRKKISVAWRLRWILERHRQSFGFYSLGVRMYPGRKTWNDPLIARTPVDGEEPEDSEHSESSEHSEEIEEMN